MMIAISIEDKDEALAFLSAVQDSKMVANLVYPISGGSRKWHPVKVTMVYRMPDGPASPRPRCDYLSPAGTQCNLRQDGHYHD